MRKIVGYTLMSLDGAVDHPGQYFAPSDDPDEPFAFDEESEAFEESVIATQDAVLLGRGMYDEWRGFWPQVADQPFATFINTVRKHVVTSRPLEGDWANTVAVSGPLDRIVAGLKAEPGRDIGVHGSIQLLQSLLGAGLVDELRIVAGPVVGAPGRRLFEGLSRPHRLRLTGCDATSAGNLLLTYEVPR